MDSKQIDQEIRELCDEGERRKLEAQGVSSPPRNTFRHPWAAEKNRVTKRLAGLDRLAAKHALELEQLNQIVRRLTDRLKLLEKGWE